MKILHTSDWHLGRTLHGADLSAAHELFFADLERIICSEQVSVLLVSGDILDRAVPSIQSLLMLESAINRLSKHCQIIISPGNHDSAVRLGFLSSQLNSRVTIVAREAQIGQPISVGQSSDEAALIYPLPYLEPDLWREALADYEVISSAPSENEQITKSQLPRSHEAVIAAALRRVARDLNEKGIKGDNPNRPKVLVMAHAFVTGATSSDSERDISVGGVDSVPSEIILSLGNESKEVDSRLDYVALGHLHRPQLVSGNPKLKYCGSPIAFSFSEAGQSKTATILTIDGTGLRSEELPLSTWRPLYRLKGSMDEVMSHAEDPQYRNAFIEVTVTDNIRPEHFHQKIKQSYPHALIIRHVPQTSIQISALPEAAGRKIDVRSIMSSFLRDMGGSEPSPEEIAILTDAYDSVRIEMSSR